MLFIVNKVCYIEEHYRVNAPLFVIEGEDAAQREVKRLDKRAIAIAKRQDAFDKFMSEWRDKQPQFSIPMPTLKNWPRWEGNQKITPEMRAEREKIKTENEALIKPWADAKEAHCIDYQDRKREVEAQWFKDNDADPKEIKGVRYNDHEDHEYHSHYNYEPIKFLKEGEYKSEVEENC